MPEAAGELDMTAEIAPSNTIAWQCWRPSMADRRRKPMTVNEQMAARVALDERLTDNDLVLH